LVEACARSVPSLTCHLVCEETDGRLDANTAAAAVASLDDPAYYLSGPPAMLTALTAQLLGRGIPLQSVFTDAWE
jgi:ferredoxin-NADP reductase